MVKKKENATNNVASMVMRKVLTGLNDYNGENYLNVSNFDDNAEGAPVALMVMHRSNKPGLNRLLGSIPGWSASAPFLNFGGMAV